MSWYVGQDGRKIWVERTELVYTVSEVEAELPLHTLTYLVSNAAKPIFAEHIVEDDIGGKKGKKSKEKQAGKQRGFVVRVDQDDKSRIIPAFRAAADRLLSSGACSRIDVDDSSGTSRKKKGPKEEEAEPSLSLLQTLGVNECRIETTGRCQHQAHGTGYRIEVAEDGQQQRLHAFTSSKQLPPADWHARLVEAVQAAGARVMLGRMVDAEPPAGAQGSGGRGPDGARVEEDAWLESVLGRCMIAKPEPAAPAPAAEASGGGGEAAEGGEGGEGSPKAAAPKKPPSALPPWLRKR